MKKFDLNIEKILENWEIKHAIREIIANAIDEQFLSKTQDIQIFKDEQNQWHIRDFGRGIKYDHFTQKENDEKLNAQGIIGKFGIGLKDALATFERHNIQIKILSKFGDIVLGKTQKTGFDDLITLHAYISEPSNSIMNGTDFIMTNVTETDIVHAQNFFLKFSKETLIEATKYGEIYNNSGVQGNIYINGVLVAQEDNFLFSYNITFLNASIKKALNRERTYVGRTAYTTSVKQILLNCQTKEIAQKLVSDFKGFSTGTLHDELKWIDVQEYAVKLLNTFEKVVFVTTEQMINATNLIDEIKTGGFEVVAIPSNLQEKIHNQTDTDGEKIRDLSQYSSERSENFEFKFVPIEQLSSQEKECFLSINEIMELIGGKPYVVKEILVSETMQRDNYTFSPSVGLWDGSRIIIKRTELRNISVLFSTFLHELSHAKSGASDVTRQFEQELSNLLGKLGDLLLTNYRELKKNSNIPNEKEIEQKYKQLYQSKVNELINNNAPKLPISLNENEKKIKEEIHSNYEKQLNQIKKQYESIIAEKVKEIEELKLKKGFWNKLFK